MLKFTIKPFDVLFFGGGKPFNIGDTARSIFPPFPHTFAGSICSKIYHEYKIDVSQILKAVYGPFLLDEKDGKIYFPKPADIYTERKESKGLFNLKSVEDSDFSLFKFKNTNKPSIIEKFPIHKGEEDIGGFEGFISQNGLQKWINGEEVGKEHIKRFSDIFSYESRVGIRQSVETHTVVSINGLYRVDFLSLKGNWSFVYYVDFNFDNLKNLQELENEDKVLKFFEQSEKVLKLGGEMRSAYYEVEKVDEIENILKKPVIEEGGKIKILFLTHSTFSFNDPFINLNNMKIISAIINGYVNLAIKSNFWGLNNFTKRGIRAGSVIFVEVLDRNLIGNLWFKVFHPYKSGNKNFIGSNLVIYGKL